MIKSPSTAPNPPPTATENARSPKVRYFEAARDAGCPWDQAQRFWDAGIILQPKQLQFAAACREADKRNGPFDIGFGGARGGSKSHGLLAQMGGDDCQRRPGLKCLLLRKVGKAVREHFQDLRLRVFSGLAHDFNQSGVLTFANGSKIIAGHFKAEVDIDAYLGLEYDVIGIEEATTLTARKMKDISTCCRTSKPDWRPRIYSTTNPGGVGHASYRARFILPYLAELAGKGFQTTTRFIPARAEDNKFNNPDYVKVLDSLTGWQHRAWRLGDWDIAAGQFFTNFRREVHVVGSEFDERRIVQWRGSLDYGREHYCAGYVGGDDRDGNLFIVDEHARRHLLPRQNADGFLSMVGRHKIFAGRIERPLSVSDLHGINAGTDIFAAESNGVSIAKQLEDAGLRCSPANTDRVNGAAEILKRLGDVDHGIKPTVFIHERCAMLISQLPEMQHDPKHPEDVLKVNIDEDGNGGDDAYDGFRYIVASKIARLEQRRVTGF